MLFHRLTYVWDYRAPECSLAHVVSGEVKEINSIDSKDRYCMT